MVEIDFVSLVRMVDTVVWLFYGGVIGIKVLGFWYKYYYIKEEIGGIRVS